MSSDILKMSIVHLLLRHLLGIDVTFRFMSSISNQQ